MIKKSTNKEKGGVALEYVLISTFAVFATIALIGIMSKIGKDKLNELTKKHDIHVEEFELNPFAK
jgi:hypothetical protein